MDLLIGHFHLKILFHGFQGGDCDMFDVRRAVFPVSYNPEPRIKLYVHSGREVSFLEVVDLEFAWHTESFIQLFSYHALNPFEAFEPDFDVPYVVVGDGLHRHDRHKNVCNKFLHRLMILVVIV